jgi:hypothetical protein
LAGDVRCGGVILDENCPMACLRVLDEGSIPIGNVYIDSLALYMYMYT